MRYIRTKDGILKKEDCFNIELNNIEFYSEDGIRFYDDIVNQADTIKELCDCFIYTDEGCEPEILYEDDLPIFPTEESELYGAIWIKGGHNEPILKPVAKANEKGKLELL